ncbi:MAG: type II secretion system protein [Candidatus Omnitrophica bacterium]|nr:type II secretion system protein [Candidatus Omnitrophota bacterium]
MRGSDGYFLLELVLIIVVIGIALLPVASSIGIALQNSTVNEAKTVAKNLAEGIMEKTLRETFLSVADASATTFPNPLDNYSYTVNCDYVQPSDLDTAVAGPTDHKRVEVTVYKNSVQYARLVSVKTDYHDEE